MTVDELKNFNPNTHEMYWKPFLKSVPKKVTVEYLYGDFFYPSIKIISSDGSGYFKFVGNNLGEYDFLEIFDNKSNKTTKCESKNFYNCFEIKPKQKESKMKTTFKQEPTKTLNNSFPKFMKSKTTSLVVLFFNETSGVVVVGNSSYNVNDFSYNFNINTFEPIENCEVTFSNKE